MIILGIDPGTASTGWGVIQLTNNRYCFLSAGTIRPKGNRLSSKYHYIYDELTEVILKYQPNAISIETQFVYKNPQSAIKISMARAMGILAATVHHTPIYEYAPCSAKQAVTGSGKASKESVDKMIRLLLSVTKPMSQDALDALSLAICHAHNHKNISSIPI